MNFIGKGIHEIVLDIGDISGRAYVMKKIKYFVQPKKIGKSTFYLPSITLWILRWILNCMSMVTVIMIIKYLDISLDKTVFFWSMQGYIKSLVVLIPTKFLVFFVHGMMLSTSCIFDKMIIILIKRVKKNELSFMELITTIYMYKWTINLITLNHWSSLYIFI